MTVTTTSSQQQPLTEQRTLLGGITALAQSAWMGFPLASDVLEQLYLSPAAALRKGRAIVPRRPQRIRLRGLLAREFSVAEASFILMASFFFSAALGSVRQVLFNVQFGVSMEANAYYAAFRLPDTLFSLIAGGALSSAMIPVLLSTRNEEGEAAGWRLISGIATTLLAFFALLIIVVEIFTPALVNNVLAPGFDADTASLTVTLTRIMLIQPLILLLGSVATAVLNSRNQFLLTGLSVLSYNVSLIIAIALVGLRPGLGIYGPTFGVVVGAILQVLILSPGLRGQAGRVRLLWDTTSARLREVIRLLIPNGLSVSVNYAGFIVDTSFATRAPEQAGLAAIYNAFLLVGLPIALLGQAVGQAAFPRLAARADEADWSGMRSLLLRTLLAALGLAIPAVLALVVLGRPTIRILFERGEFTAAAGDLTFAVLTIYAIGLPAYVATEVVTRGLISMRDTRTPLMTNTMQLVLRIMIIAVLLARLGVVSIPIAFVVSSVIETVILTTVLLVRLRRRIRVGAKE
ncbi:MAG: murein biosynthesis integral membrane protein MurJ [Caldilineales bacterium]|nr:murein biosynthesis integral membrane protein MurJ [Caldilineales bacterium]